MGAALHDVQFAMGELTGEPPGRGKRDVSVAGTVPPFDVHAHVTWLEVPRAGNRECFVRPSLEALAKSLTPPLGVSPLRYDRDQARSVLGRGVGQDPRNPLTQEAPAELAQVRVDTLPPSFQRRAEGSVRPNQVLSLGRENWACPTAYGDRANTVRVPCAERQRVGSASAQCDHRDHSDIQRVEKFDEIVGDDTEPSPRQSGGGTESRSVHHDHLSADGKRIGTSGQARRRCPLEAHDRFSGVISPATPGQRPAVGELEPSVDVGNAFLIPLRPADHDHVGQPVTAPG
jgi:hypothetical protein